MYAIGAKTLEQKRLGKNVASSLKLLLCLVVWVVKGRQEGDKRETKRRQKGDERETRGRQKGDKRETKGRQKDIDVLHMHMHLLSMVSIYRYAYSCDS